MLIQIISLVCELTIEILSRQMQIFKTLFLPVHLRFQLSVNDKTKPNRLLHVNCFLVNRHLAPKTTRPPLNSPQIHKTTRATVIRRHAQDLYGHPPLTQGCKGWMYGWGSFHEPLYFNKPYCGNKLMNLIFGNQLSPTQMQTICFDVGMDYLQRKPQTND